jgi:hypothetical protein
MTATDLEATSGSRTRPPVWPWAVLSAAVVALVLPMAILMLGAPDAWTIGLTVASAVVGFALAYALAPRPRLRILLLAGGTLVAAVWAAWCYRTNMHRWPVDIDGYTLPWGVSNIPEWAVIAQPVAVGLCVVVAVIALVRRARGRLVHSALWTALLSITLLVCLVAGFQVLSARAFLA